MNCDDVKRLIHDYLDNQLDSKQAKEFEQALTKCPAEFNYFDKLNKLLVKFRSLPLNFEPNKEILTHITETLMSSKIERKEEKSQAKEKTVDEKKQKAKQIKDDDHVLVEREIRRKARRKRTIISILIIILISISVYYFYNNFLILDKPWVVQVLSGNIKINNHSPQTNQLEKGDLIWLNTNSKARILIPNIASINLNGLSTLRIIETKKQNKFEIIFGNVRYLSLSQSSNFEILYKQFTINEKNGGFNFVTTEIDSNIVDVFQGYITISNAENKKINVVKNYRVILQQNLVSIPIRKNADNEFRNLALRLSREPNNSDALVAILIKAQKSDVFSLFEIFKLANPTNREMILDKINNNYPIPSNISKTEVLLLYPEALEKYWTSIFESYSK